MTKEILIQQVPQYFDFGTPFNLHLYEMFPDLIKIAKSLTSAYLPPPGVIVVKLVWGVIEQISEELDPMGDDCNYSGHTLGTAAGLSNLDILERERLTENASDSGVYLQQQFYEAFDNHPQVGEVHGMGLVDALEFVADKTKKQRFDADWKVYPKVRRCVLSKNWLSVLYTPNGDILSFAPPLRIT